MRTFILLAIVITWLSACSGPERLWNDYLSRLARVLNEDIPPSTSMQLPQLPALRDLQVEVQELEISIFDAWNIRHCELFTLVSERNSILGKLSEPEMRLRYEVQLLELLPQCAAHPETDNDLANLLTEVLKSKEENFETVLWNSTFANADFRQMYSLSEQPFPTNKALDTETLADEFERLSVSKNLRTNLYQHLLAITEFNHSLAAGGATLQSQRLSIDALNRANIMLTNATQNGNLCPNGLVLKELEIARNVMANVFIGKVQPWLVRVTKGYRSSYEQGISWSSSFGNIPEENKRLVQNYFDEAAILNSNYLESIRTHTQAWQRLFEQCNRSATP